MRLVGAILALALLLAPAGVRAADDGAPLILVIDVQGVVRDSAAAKGIQQQIDELRRSYQEEFGAIEEQFRAMEAQLAQDRTVLPPDQFDAKLRDFEQRLTEMQREAQARRAALDMGLDQAMDTVRTALLEVVSTIARERNAHVVLNKAQVVLVDRALDVSADALARLNQQLPYVQVHVAEQ